MTNSIEKIYHTTQEMFVGQDALISNICRNRITLDVGQDHTILFMEEATIRYISKKSQIQYHTQQPLQW